MTTTTFAVDYRRTDQRTNVLENPFWITSGLVSCLACVGAGALLFSFPRAGELIIVHDVVARNETLAVGGSAVSIGLGTINTDAAVSSAITDTAVDSFIPANKYVVTANTCWGPTADSGWLAVRKTGSFATPRIIVGAISSSATVPCVYAVVGSLFSAGTFRVSMLISIIPGT